MSRPPLAARAARAAVVFAAVLTFAAAVGMDLLADEHPLHTVTLGLVAGVLGIARVRAGGARGGFFSVASGVVVAQPALHAAMMLLPAASVRAGGPGPPDHLVETSTTATHVLVAAAVVAVVGGAEQLARSAGAARLLAWWWAAFVVTPVAVDGTPAPAVSPAPPVAAPFATVVSRRGPPAAGPAVAP
jgi:hypothetical protein